MDIEDITTEAEANFQANMATKLPSLFENFNSKKEDFACWMERFSCYIECTAVPDTAKTKFFIASVGPETYNTLKKLTVPKKPAELTFDEITN